MLLLSLTFFQCKQSTNTNTVKFQPDDPFMNTMVASQSFAIDSKIDNVVEGENGTVVVCPKGCFKDAKGEIFEGNVNIELSEALTLEEMLLSNLTTTSNGKQLETGGMIYFNATANGEQLTINKDNPIHIEIPTDEKKGGMMAYKGIRDEKGNMNWIAPKALDNYLLTVDINTLDFLPQGFQAAVDTGMPFRSHETATQALTDSLYYSLAQEQDGYWLSDGFVNTKLNEPYYNKGKQIENGKYTSESYESGAVEVYSDSARTTTFCGIDPRMIKVIKSDKYQNTFIATKAFEARLNVIFKTCNNAVLDTYIHNLDKNLFEVDSIAAITLGGNEYRQDFVNFSLQRLTKVKDADKNAELLKGYFEKQLAKVNSELEQAEAKLKKELDAKNNQAQKLADEYKQLLWKRESYRMETYGFDWTETGWINVDNGTLPKDWGKKPLEINLANGKQFDRVYTYVVYTSIKSLYRLNTDDNEQFYAGNDEDKEMLMPKNELGVAIAIGYKAELPSLAVKEFKTGSEPKFSLTLAASSLKEVKEAISKYEKYARENKMSVDLEFMAKFYQEEQRQKKLMEESEFIYRLSEIAYPCCLSVGGEGE